MKNQINKVEEFHKAFNVINGDSPKIKLDDIMGHFLRHRLMEEENNEYLEACLNNDMVEIADALGDQLYILLGTILKHGMQHKIEEVFDEIHRSNMSKLDAEGNPILREDGKVLKGENYFKPNIEKILNPSDRN